MRSGAAGIAALFWLAGAACRGGDPEKGKALFEPCSVCHDPTSMEKRAGPGLKGLFKRSKLSNGQRVSESNVRAVIDEGASGMPAFKDMLSPQEKDHLIAYLKTL